MFYVLCVMSLLSIVTHNTCPFLIMLPFTKQEKLVLLSVSVVFLVGTSVDYIFKKCPFLKNAVNLVETDALYERVNVNTATLEELMRVPYIGEVTAKKIIEFRQHKGHLRDIQELAAAPGLYPRNFERFRKYLKTK